MKKKWRRSAMTEHSEKPGRLTKCGWKKWETPKSNVSRSATNSSHKKKSGYTHAGEKKTLFSLYLKIVYA